MSLSMITPVTADTINQLAPNAGILLKNFDFSGATGAHTLMALVVSSDAQANNWMGATKGGINVQENKSYWSPEVDGKRMPFKGDKYFESAEPKITGTLVALTPDNVKAISGAANKSVSGNITTIQPLAEIRKDDYFDNIVYIVNKGSDGLYLVELDNAICITGMNGQSQDKDITTLPFEFAGNSANAAFNNELPIKYLFFGPDVVEQVAAGVITSAAGTSVGGTKISISTAAGTGQKWVYKLGTADVTPEYGTAVTGYADWADNTTEIAAGSSTKACLILVTTSDMKPVKYGNISLTKKTA